jgi:hypothetical protein
MNCADCGMEVQPEWNFCPNCSLYLLKIKEDSPAEKSSSVTAREKKRSPRRRQRSIHRCCYSCGYYSWVHPLDNWECNNCEKEIDEYGMEVGSVPVCERCEDADDVKKTYNIDGWGDTLYYCNFHKYIDENCDDGPRCYITSNKFINYEYWCESCDVGIESGCRHDCTCPIRGRRGRKKSRRGRTRNSR